MNRNLLIPVLIVLISVFASADDRTDFQDEIIRQLHDGLRDFIGSDLMKSETRDLLADVISRDREELEENDNEKTQSRSPDDTSDEDNDKDDDDEDTDEVSHPDFSVSINEGGFPNIFNILRRPEYKPWWQGENVCVDREIKQENKTSGRTENAGNFFIFGTAAFSSCKHSSTKYVCTTITSQNGETKTTVVTYKCCHGYQRLSNKPGCEKVDMKPLSEIANEVGASKFFSLVNTNNMLDIFEKNNMTIFLPRDSAMDNIGVDSEQDSINNEALESNDVNSILSTPYDKKSSFSKEFLLNHIVKGLYDTGEFYNDRLIENENGVRLRLNVFPSRLGSPRITVNCVPFNLTDKLTEHGIVHVINDALPVASRSVRDILKQEKYSKFMQLLDDYNLLDKVEDEDGKTVTIFAITNDVFDNLEKKDMCIRKILQHHILPHTVCSAAVADGKISAQDSVDNWLVMTSDEETGEIRLGNGKVSVVDRDILATNGVVHNVDGFIIPNSARSISELLESTNRTNLLNLLKKTDLIDEFDKMHNITFILPSEIALKNSNLNDLEDINELKTILKNHMFTAGPKTVDDLVTMDSMKNMNGGKVTVGVHSNIFSIISKANVQCQPLTRVDGHVCNGIVHEVDGVIKSADKSAYEIIYGMDDRFSQFKKLLEGTDLETEMKDGFNKFRTVLAPTNEAFEKVDEETLNTLFSDKKMADKILRNHILLEPSCCNSVRASVWPFISTVEALSGYSLEVDRPRFASRVNYVNFNGARTVQCDVMAKDAIVHFVDKLILPAIKGNRKTHHNSQDIILKRPNSEIILTGLDF